MKKSCMFYLAADHRAATGRRLCADSCFKCWASLELWRQILLHTCHVFQEGKGRGGTEGGGGGEGRSCVLRGHVQMREN